MKTAALTLTLVALSCVPALAQAQDAPAPRTAELHVGFAAGAPYTALIADDLEGWAMDARVELRLYEPGGLGGVIRPIVQLGSPNLIGGELGGAYQGVLAELGDGLELVAGGAVGLSIAQRFYLAPPSFGALPSPGPADQDHTVVGYFAELHAEVRFRNGLYLGIAALHRGFVADTHPQSRSPFFSIEPSLRFGRAFDL